MKVRPLHDRVLIKRIEEQETVRGGSIISDTAQQKDQLGGVVATVHVKLPETGSVYHLERKEGGRGLL